MRLETYLDAYAKAYSFCDFWQNDEDFIDLSRSKRQRDKFRQHILNHTALITWYDRLTVVNSQLLLACMAARRHLTEDGLQDFEPIIMQLRAAIRAAEDKPITTTEELASALIDKYRELHPEEYEAAIRAAEEAK